MAKRGAKPKYERLVKPYLNIINEKIRQGVTEAEIAKALNISVASLNNYKLQHQELKDALSRNKGADVLQGLVNAGIKAATGYYAENEQTVYGVDERGNPVIKQVVKNKVWQPANPALNKFYVQNYGKDQGYTDNPLDYELKKQKAEFDKKIAEANNWDLNIDNDK
jgi:hypothetical protein